jgi:hypothetical protein
MSPHAVSTLQPEADVSPRSIVQRTRGRVHGPVTRLVSPGDLGQMIKPFVFLDYFEGEPADAPAFGFHPHSGIATLTLILSGAVTYKETTDREGVVDTDGCRVDARKQWRLAHGRRPRHRTRQGFPALGRHAAGA